MSTNLRKKALLPIIAMVLVSVIALSGVTYAWFTMSDSATVSDLQVNVKSADGIQISLDAANWKSSFNLDDIKNANIASNQVPESEVRPVSSAGVASAGRMAMYLGELNEDNTLTISACEDGQNSDYIVFDLYFKMAHDDTPVTLDGSSFVEEVGTAAAVDSVNSARVAFVDFGTADTATDAVNLQTLDTDTGVVIWEPAKETGVTYRGLNATGTVATKNGVVEAETNSASVTTVNENEVTLNLDAGFNKVRIYIWMEGQDADCTNDASGGTFNTTLKFVQPSENA